MLKKINEIKEIRDLAGFVVFCCQNKKDRDYFTRIIINDIFGLAAKNNEKFIPKSKGFARHLTQGQFFISVEDNLYSHQTKPVLKINPRK